jgi:hypothetical protein
MQRENKHEADLKKNGATPLRKKPKPCLSDDRVALLEGIGTFISFVGVDGRLMAGWLAGWLEFL